MVSGPCSSHPNGVLHRLDFRHAIYVEMILKKVANLLTKSLYIQVGVDNTALGY